MTYDKAIVNEKATEFLREKDIGIHVFWDQTSNNHVNQTDC